MEEELNFLEESNRSLQKAFMLLSEKYDETARENEHLKSSNERLKLLLFKLLDDSAEKIAELQTAKSSKL